MTFNKVQAWQPTSEHMFGEAEMGKEITGASWPTILTT